jgi:hypothetical protein
LFTVATPVLAEAQDNVLFPASSGNGVAESCTIWPTVRLIVVSLREMTSTSFGPIFNKLSGQAEKIRAARTHQGAARKDRGFLIETPLGEK